MLDPAPKPTPGVVRSEPCLKKDAPPELVESIQRIEHRADRCFHSLKILELPPDVALWSLLVGGVHLVEREIDMRGEDTAHLDATLVNTSSLVSTAIKWVVKSERHSSATVCRKWTLDLAAKVDAAVALAHNYGGFLNILPMWHKNRCRVELLSPNRARFTVVGSDVDRRVSGYQKGFRPKTGCHRGERGKKLAPTATVNDLFEKAYADLTPLGDLGFLCSDPWKLWVELLPEYKLRVEAISRRDDALSLGDYTLREFKRFYAAFLAVCATREHLCFAWHKNYGRYPSESVVMIRTLEDWSKTLSNLAGVKASLCRSIIRDITFNFSSSPNLHVSPFVPLDSSWTQLAVAPHFPLHSRLDENILWVCSKLRAAQFDATSVMKEPEMYAALEKICSRYLPQGAIRLPNPNPDIDLLLTDEDSSTVMIAELKWIRKPTKSFERIRSDEDVLKGFDQLRKIRRFLEQNPNHLVSIRKLPKPLREYHNVQYAVIARDHWVWVPPSADGAIFTYDAFAACVNRCPSLKDAIEGLLTYDWLPVEARDYAVKYDESYADGVVIETETYYAL
ncbi:MAG: hypothetical protein ACRD4R_10505 [Candidatus Acidiferrales bacterium]